MKITYVGPTGDPVRSIDGGASAARRAVKTTLKNLKRWYARLWRGTTTRVGFKGDQQNCPDEIKVLCGRMRPTMIVDRVESRDRANEKLENELRQSLATNNGQSELHRCLRQRLASYVYPLINDSTEEDDELPVPRMERRPASQALTRTRR